MDPNANLKEQLELAKDIAASGGRANADDVLRLTELVLAMDQWLKGGGSLPDAWLCRF